MLERRGESGPRLRVRTGRPVPAVVVVHVDGEIDAMTSPELEAVVREAAAALPEVLVLDVHDVRFCGASGVGVLLRARDLVAAAGGTLRLAGAPAAVRRPLEVLGLAGEFETCTRAVVTLPAPRRPVEYDVWDAGFR
ncbi:STAS domain-containing protein [Amycolatopsis sacchari]|uniref:Anti-sigma factor antagonist n=1 Tax=Amycolatopsis sacchari TaxID=115433 RepID=A0A1I3JVU3_9PSEU|nr:STAS domain-containing protein [Amycolatopsis sacchari]SFI64138.1 anti-anti-sigma factor [Amycolatopsis sacchari]